MADITNDIVDICVIGAKYRISYGEHDPTGNRLFHVRAIVDEEEIVVRYWNPRKGWRYMLTSRYELYLANKGGNLQRVK